MQNAEQILQAMHKLGDKRIPLTRVYRCLFSEELYLLAYNKLYRNRGALTPGTENDTVDGMSLERIHSLIEAIRQEQFKFRPSRRAYRSKKNGGQRPLGIPNFTEKLVQEVIRMLLEAYYEPRFRDSSHGFRPERGCHTALKEIRQQFHGTTWFIEGDIRGCFDNIDHDILMGILARDIHDGRMLNLIRQSLQAGVLEQWHYHHTYSGTPQGGVLSPLLANLYLNELDSYIEDVLIPEYTQGKKRGPNPEYQKCQYQLSCARQRGDLDAIKTWQQHQRQLPSVNMYDPNYRRLKYIRYADDFILGFIGPKSEAEALKTAIGDFLREHLKLEMSQAKTLITHARTEHAKFLGYAISIEHANHKLTRRKDNTTKMRSINGNVRLGIPYGLIDHLSLRYQHKGKVVSESGMLLHSDAHIIYDYQMRFRGIAEYYKYATDRHQLNTLKWVMQQALTKTLAHKFKISIPKVYQRYRGTRLVDGQEYATLQVEVPTQTGTKLIYWGAIPLKVVKTDWQPLNDQKYLRWTNNVRYDLLQRLQADKCELCGQEGNCEVHHIRKLADLKARWQGRKEKPNWVKRMIALRRKTLIVCKTCHQDIHTGKYTPNDKH